MPQTRHGLPPQIDPGHRPTRSRIVEIEAFLQAEGTFEFPTLSTGLFSAAAAPDPEFRLTGYQYVWTRDNVHIAHALWRVGQTGMARHAVAALLQFYVKHRHKFQGIIDGRLSPGDPMNRPHIRFDGESLEEIDVKWAHAQNDALGYVLWLACEMIAADELQAPEQIIDLFGVMVRYFAAVKYWQDEDSGHWEEARKIEASSLGPVVRGLRALRPLLDANWRERIDADLLDEILAHGEQALAEILPAECTQLDPLKARRYDAALIFLIYPLEVVDSAMATQIIDDVRQQLTGPIGIRRYNGDSYWCADYRDLLSADTRTADFSDDMSARDKLLVPGQEAQWCIFDPILSVIHGRRYLATGDEAELAAQRHHFRRSLGQLTTEESRFPPYRCPESYFLERGHWIPNDITPLLWTQANLLLALHGMKQTATET